MRKSIRTMVAQPDFRLFCRDIKAYQFFISKGNLKLDDDCTETWYLIRKYKITQDELNYLLGIYRYYRDKEREEIAEIAGIKYLKKDMPTKNMRSIHQALTILKKNKWLDENSVSSIKKQIVQLLLDSDNGKDFVNQQLVSLFLKKYNKHKDPELSLLIIQLADLMKLKTGRIEYYNTMAAFFEEQGIEITNRGNTSSEGAIKKRYDRGKKNIKELMWIRKCKILLPMDDVASRAEPAITPPTDNENELIQKSGAEIATHIASVPAAYRDLLRAFGDHYVSALEKFYKDISIKA